MIPIDWNQGDVEGHVSLGSHSVFMIGTGIERRPASTTPAVILEAGMGDSNLWWRAVMRLVKPFARVYAYDRAGLGKSEKSPLERTASNMAKELSMTLRAADIAPPFVIVSASYGGILAREFLAIHPNEVAGMVFVDTQTETTYTEFLMPWTSIYAIMGDLDYYKITGLDEDHMLEPEEFEAIKSNDNGCLYAEKDQNSLGQETRSATDAEQAMEERSCRELADKHQFENQPLGDSPVVVIKGNSTRDYIRIFMAGIAAGNGTQEQRIAMADLISIMGPDEECLQKEQLRLSSTSKYVQTLRRGHNLHITEPEVVADQVRWVLQRCGAEENQKVRNGSGHDAV